VSDPGQVLSDRYDPVAVEARWYPLWESRGYFSAEPKSQQKPYSIVIPPPNVTGSLHMGHASEQHAAGRADPDERMDGFSALWVPGTDHAGIATQVVVKRSRGPVAGRAQALAAG